MIMCKVICLYYSNINVQLIKCLYWKCTSCDTKYDNLHWAGNNKDFFMSGRMEDPWCIQSMSASSYISWRVDTYVTTLLWVWDNWA